MEKITVQSIRTTRTPSLLAMLVKLSFFLFIMQILVVTFSAYFSGISSIAIAKSMLFQLLTTSTTLIPILAYCGAQLLLQVFFVTAIYVMTNALAAKFTFVKQNHYTLGICLWLFYVFAIFTINTLTFNQSIFALFT